MDAVHQILRIEQVGITGRLRRPKSGEARIHLLLGGRERLSYSAELCERRLTTLALDR